MRLSVADGHLCNMGRMIEEMESKLRNSLDQVLLDYRIHPLTTYFGRRVGLGWRSDCLLGSYQI